MNIDDIKERARVSMEAIKQMREQEKIFEGVIKEAIKNAPEEAKKDISRFNDLFMDVKRLAKSGDISQAEELIKNFDYASKNNK